MSAVDTTILDVDSILDASLDAVENIPDYVTPPDGNYKLSVESAKLNKLEAEGDKKKIVRLEVTYKVEATVETKGMPVADGSLFTERFNYSDDGLKYFKRQAKNLLNVSDLDGTSIRQIFDALESTPAFDAVITSSVTKGTGDNKDKSYTNVRVRAVYPVIESA